MKLEGSSFVITGGASGLGEATARRLVASNARVILMDLNEERGNQLVAELGGTSKALFFKTNITDEASVRAAITSAVSSFGSIQGLINCAGIAIGQRVVSKGPKAHSLDAFSKVLMVNVVGSFNVLRLVAEQMAKQEPSQPDSERGVFINTASVAAFEGQIGQAAYSASKGAIVSMTLPIARELAGLGIRCNTIAPGTFLTPMMAGMKPEVQQSLAQSIPFPKRLGNPEEFAKLCEHIITNTFINGETIRIDGSIRMAAL